MSRKQFLLTLVPLGLAVVAIAGAVARPSPGRESEQKTLESKAQDAAAPAVVAAEETLAIASVAAVKANERVAHKAVARTVRPARRSAAASMPSIHLPFGPPKKRQAFRRQLEAAQRGIVEEEGPRGESSGFDEWFYGQRGFPGGSIPAGALARALDQAERSNGGLVGGPGEPSPQEGLVPLPTWASIGPSTIPDGQVDTSANPAVLSPVSGRLTAIAVHPQNPNIVFAGGAQGGVWRTTNALAASPLWTPLTDHAASLAIGDIAIDPVNPNIIYAGTGENNGSCDSYYGQGMLRSTDGGATWTMLGRTSPTFPNGTGPFTARSISKVVIDHSTAGSASNTRVWATTGTAATTSGTQACTGVTFAPVGLWRSNDSGLTWSQINVNGATNISHRDLLIDPTNADILYVAVGGNGVWKSVDARSAVPTFTRMGSGFVTNVGPSPTFSRITTSIGGPSAPTTLYASLQASTQNLWGMYKTTDGVNWAHIDAGNNGTANVVTGTATITRVTGPGFSAAMVGRRVIVNNQFSRTVATVTPPDTITVTGGNFTATLSDTSWSVGAYPNYCDGQCFYNITIGVDPADASVLFVGGNPRPFNGDLNPAPFPGNHSVWRSTDGGNSWGSVSQGDGVKGGLHVDDHDIVFDTSVTPSRVYDGNDGGIWRSDDRGASWDHMNTNIAITQFQGVALHPTNSAIVLGGTQDNGTNILNPGLQPAPKWYHADFGDGGLALIDQTNPSRMFHTYFNQANNFMGPAKSLIGGAGGPGSWDFVGAYAGAGGAYHNGIDAADPVSFYAPIASHPAFSPNLIYFGTNKLYRATDPDFPCCDTVSTSGCGGSPPTCTNPPSWTVVSPVLTEDPGPTFAAFISAIGVLPHLVGGNEVIYTGARDGRIAVSSDVNGSGVATWTVLTTNAGGPVMPNAFITEIEVARNDASGNTAYVTTSGFNSFAGRAAPGHVFKTTNGLSGAATWINISGDLPDVPTNAIAIDYATTPLTLYVGTDIGVFRSQNDGANWTYLSAGHPVVSVFGLDRNGTTGQLVSSTHGRGMFQLTTTPAGDTVPPTCGGSVSANVFNGTANDDVGIASIQLGPGSSNLALSQIEYVGPRSATFRVAPVAGTCGAGTVVVTDQGGNTCSLTVTINALAAPDGGSNSPLRAGTTLNLTAADVAGATWSWTGPNNFASSSRTPSIPNVSEANEGTYYVSYRLGGCPSAADPVPVVVTPATNDFNFDGKQDIMWRHELSGENVVWFMDGATLISGTFTNPPVLADTNWKIGGTSDFNGDGKTDFLWRHAVSGELVVWFMDGMALQTGTFLNPAALPDPNWKVVGTGDFDRDGKADIAWRHEISGEMVIWYMNGITLTSGTFTTPSAFADTNWKIRGLGDFDRDGDPDFFWRHETTGELVVWFMNNSVLVSGAQTTPPSLPDTQWVPSAFGDYDNDGEVDIVWRHGTSGQNVIWFMNGILLDQGTLTTTLPDVNWKIVGPK